MEKKRILVLMSTYNGEKYIQQQLLSILNQKVDANIYIKIRDDGSSDKTFEILQSNQQKYPDIIEIVKGKNIGCNASFFELLNSSFGYDYYAISDQDDVWFPEKLQTACEYLGKEDDTVPLLYASAPYLVDANLNPYGMGRKKERDFTIYNTIIQNICPGHSQMMNNALLRKLQGNLDISRLYAYDAWITNMAILYGKIIYNNNPFVYYRQHGDNSVGTAEGTIGCLLLCMKRIAKGDGHKYKKQIEYFIEYNETELKVQKYYNELERFVRAKNIVERIIYTMHGKLYRQRKEETLAFYIAFLLGKF